MYTTPNNITSPICLFCSFGIPCNYFIITVLELQKKKKHTQAAADTELTWILCTIILGPAHTRTWCSKGAFPFSKRTVFTTCVYQITWSCRTIRFGAMFFKCSAWTTFCAILYNLQPIHMDGLQNMHCSYTGVQTTFLSLFFFM